MGKTAPVGILTNRPNAPATSVDIDLVAEEAAELEARVHPSPQDPSPAGLGGSVQWSGWASWPVTPTALVVAAVAIAGDV
ncbi:MAG: hypothetical protein ABW073_03705, partial [Acidimicrobiia bacterium]